MILHTDGGARGNPGHAAIGVVFFDKKDGTEVFKLGKYIGRTTNNDAEYQALILGLETALTNSFTNLTCKLDSELVVKQMQGLYKVKEPRLQELHKKAKALVKKFAHIEFVHIPRSQNKEADLLVNQKLDEQTQAN